MALDGTPEKKEEIHERRVRRAFQPAPWLVVAALLMVMLALSWIFFF